MLKYTKWLKCRPNGTVILSLECRQHFIYGNLKWYLWCPLPVVVYRGNSFCLIMQVCHLPVGEQFASFELLSKRITETEQRENLSLWKWDSRSIEKTKTRGVKRHMNADLAYYSVHYACYHGGRKFKSKSVGVRTNLRWVTVYYAVITYVHMRVGWNFSAVMYG